MTDLSTALAAARKAAKIAAKLIREKYGDNSNARVKGKAQGLVTDTDLESEKVIFEILQKETPYNILSEESGLLNNEPGPKWIVDPVDGTNNFARGLPFFVVSIGLMDENEFVVGVITEPVTGNEYYAVKGGGAFKNEEKLELPAFQKDFMPTVFINHGYKEVDRNTFRQVVNKLALRYNTLKLGTTALEMVNVATGSVDAFISSGDSMWDFAGGAVIATEAGCKFTDWQGSAWSGKGSRLLLARPEVQDELVKILKEL
ncbi:MAG: inositol monophosphatase family protein [Prolixibacteraceae bacterium]